MSKKITYHKSHSFKDTEGVSHSFLTELYKIGVYGILDGDPSMQGGYSPTQIVKIEKGLSKLAKKGKITDLQFGNPITVQKIDGLWKEIKV